MRSKHFAIERVSVSSTGTAGNGDSFFPDISWNGRYVAYHSVASNLVPGDGNNTEDVFVYDRKVDTTEIISVDNEGDEGNASSVQPAISANGRFVTYQSDAPNLVPGDDNNATDIFVRDRTTDTTEIVSVTSNGDAANGSSSQPTISANGRYVVFESDASNLVPGDNNIDFDVFLHDRRTGTTERVSVSSGGAEALGPSSQGEISANGRFISFTSLASNLVPGDLDNTSDVFVYDREKGTTELVSFPPDQSGRAMESSGSAISANGRFVAFTSIGSGRVPGGGNTPDVFVYDRKKGTTELVSVSSDGTEGNLHSFEPSISADGRYVTFYSEATNLAPDDDNNATDVFVRDRKADTTTLLSVAPDGTVGNGGSFDPAISGSGHYVAFSSSASNLVRDDDNGVSDIFVAARFGWLL
jgi:Tol biopolymer transport system component